MVNKLKLATSALSPIELLLIGATEDAATAQQKYDDALDVYADKRAEVEYAALSTRLFEDKDGNLRSASNDLERRTAQKVMCARDEALAVLRKAVRQHRRSLKLEQQREKNYRAILAAKVAAE
jgi:hypothetical protein